MQIRIYYHLSPTYRRTQFETTGEHPKQEAYFCVDSPLLTSPERHVVATRGKLVQTPGTEPDGKTGTSGLPRWELWLFNYQIQPGSYFPEEAPYLAHSILELPAPIENIAQAALLLRDLEARLNRALADLHLATQAWLIPLHLHRNDKPGLRKAAHELARPLEQLRYLLGHETFAALMTPEDYQAAPEDPWAPEDPSAPEDPATKALQATHPHDTDNEEEAEGRRSPEGPVPPPSPVIPHDTNRNRTADDPRPNGARNPSGGTGPSGKINQTSYTIPICVGCLLPVTAETRRGYSCTCYRYTLIRWITVQPITTDDPDLDGPVTEKHADRRPK